MKKLAVGALGALAGAGVALAMASPVAAVDNTCTLAGGTPRTAPTT